MSSSAHVTLSPSLARASSSSSSHASRATSARSRAASVVRAATSSSSTSSSSPEYNIDDDEIAPLRSRRRTVLTTLSSLALASSPLLARPSPSRADESGLFCDYTQTLPCDEYPKYERTASGLLFQDLRYGEGDAVAPGRRVVVDWDGYTFYLSHVLQARNLPKGGDFEQNDDAFLSFIPGDGTVIPAFDECVKDMRVGGIRRFIVRPGPLSYPGVLKGNWKEGKDGVGPVPASLSGKRALEFVNRNTANVDKSLLFDVEILGVEGEDGRMTRGFRRGPGRWAEGVKQRLS